MGRGSIEISVYAPPPVSGELARFHQQERWWNSTCRFFGGSVTGAVFAALLSVALHGWLLTCIFWGTGTHAPRTPDAGALATIVTQASDDGALQVVILPDASIAPGATLPRVVLSDAPAIVAIPFSHALQDIEKSLPEISVDSAGSVTTPTEDGAGRSAMYGRYIGQIDARIQRAWSRPRTPIGAAEFTCIARIDQDAQGTVQEVTLEQCNGDARWQRSLVSAIESASPLPAPPDPTVFTRTLHLSFEAEGYSPTAPQDAYEPPAAAAQIGNANGDHP